MSLMSPRTGLLAVKARELFPSVAAVSISLSERPLLGPCQFQWAVKFVHICYSVFDVLSDCPSSFPVDVGALS